MAYKITEECILCGACEPECPSEAIGEGEAIYVIDPNKCTECVGWYDESQCALVCPVDSCIPDPDHEESHTELLAKFRKLRPGVEHVPISDPDWAAFLSEALFPILPAIELLSDFQPLPSEVNVAQRGADDREMEAARRMLQLGGVDDLYILSHDSPDRDEVLEHASQEITKAVREYWTQDTEVQLKVTASGDKIRFHILVLGCPAFTRPEWHSQAFREYLSLLAGLLLRIRDAEKPLILLLDEPAVRLHPRAQRDLVQLFRKLSHRAQLIYTAHYPYLIDRNFPGQLRLLGPKPDGTKINNKPYHAEAYSLAWEPIRTALGLTVGDCLLYDDYNVIVEGVTDQLLLCAISQELSKIGDDRTLDLNYIAVFPAGGASKQAEVAQRALAHGLHVVAVFDGEKARERDIKSFNDKVPNAPRPLWLREFYNVPYDFSIEDMLPTGLYLDAVNSLYQTIFDTYTPIEAKYLKGRKESVVKIIQRLLPKAIAGGSDEAAAPQQDSERGAENDKEPPNGRGKTVGSPEAAFALAKVEVVKEAICLLRERGVLNKKGKLLQKYDRFANLFEKIKKRLKATVEIP